MTQVKRRRGFTLIETVATLVILGVVLSFAVTRLGSTGEYGSNARAQATASAAVDTQTHLWLSTGGYGPNGSAIHPAAATLAAANPNSPGDAGLGGCTDPTADPAGLFAAANPAGTQQTGQYPDGQVTNCPAFANPYTLHLAGGSVGYVDGATDASDSTTASVAAESGPDGWVIAATSANGSTCMAARRSIPLASAQATAATTYFVLPGPCTATAVLAEAACTSNGSSWRDPCTPADKP